MSNPDKHVLTEEQKKLAIELARDFENGTFDSLEEAKKTFEREGLTPPWEEVDRVVVRGED